LKNRIVYFFLLILFLTDLGFSFFQHFSQPLDGDMAWVIVPSNDVQQVLDNPLGLKAIFSNQNYIDPNRFFSHWIMREYFLTTPTFLQNFVSPIDSVYLACAIAKVIIQALLVFLLSYIISGTGNIFKLDFILSAVLVTPFFQINGFRSYMGIIDPATTYNFFYALPSALLLVYLMPLINHFYHKRKFPGSVVLRFIWILFSVVICLSGPLNPGIILILSLILVVCYLKRQLSKGKNRVSVNSLLPICKQFSSGYLFFLLPAILFSIYSLFLGRYNSLTLASQIHLGDMYLKIPQGLYNILTQKLGFPLLLMAVALNAIIIKKSFPVQHGNKILTALKYIGFFSIIYIMLLPLGGYRSYRADILRYDTIMPITLSLIFIFGASALFILKSMSRRQRLYYLPFIIGMLFIYTNADRLERYNNLCERNSLELIASSKNDTIRISNSCTVLSWEKITKPEDSDLNANWLQILNITKSKKLYYSE